MPMKPDVTVQCRRMVKTTVRYISCVGFSVCCYLFVLKLLQPHPTYYVDGEL